MGQDITKSCPIFVFYTVFAGCTDWYPMMLIYCKTVAACNAMKMSSPVRM